MTEENNEVVKLPEEVIEKEDAFERDEEYLYLKKLRDEALRKFKEKFPNGATIESGEFLE